MSCRHDLANGTCTQCYPVRPAHIDASRRRTPDAENTYGPNLEGPGAVSFKASGDFSLGGALWPGLSKLLEECGEVQQVCGKLIGSHGNVEHWDGTNLRDRLIEELADLEAAIRFVVEHNDLDTEKFVVRINAKQGLFEKWHREGQ